MQTASAKGRGGRRTLPYAFTEQGVAMLSSVLHSERAVLVNVAIMRVFVQLRQMLAANADLAKRLAALEARYDKQFRAVFEAIRQLMAEHETAEPPVSPGESKVALCPGGAAHPPHPPQAAFSAAC